MATTKAGPVNADRLKSFVERIEKLEEERQAIGGDIKDVYSEAKGVGYDVKTMRKIVQLRSMDAADRAEAETLLDTYCHALGMVYVSTSYAAPQPTEEELEALAGRMVAEVDRCMDLVTGGQPPGIYAIRGLIGCSAGKASKLRGMVADRISRETAKVREMKSTPHDADGVVTETQEKADDEGGLGAGGSAGLAHREHAGEHDAKHDVVPGRLEGADEGRSGSRESQPDEAPAPRSVGAVSEEASIAAMEEAGARLRASLAARRSA